ncbi:39S ribosomal protein L22, mitochondrial isoform X2 [Venturia canescens]|nr:39S ribosomal protein L22, mitochondrial isoform X2 [Venturia canescens]XP_043267210.1 39S ribosomal protein L22, mitochondrial isoform X2 [Venturia canescens]
MQSLQRCISSLASLGSTSVSRQQLKYVLPKAISPMASIHSSAICEKYQEPRKFLRHNKTIFPVQAPDEERRPAYVCHMKSNLKYSLKKMWYLACLVRGMSVDEAIKQLSFQTRKGSAMIKETILEAQQLAVEEHNVEFKSNLWVAESFATKGIVIKGLRRHARARIGEVRYGYVHYFVRLEEGTPPENYYLPAPKGTEELLEDWKEKMRKRKIYNSL